jgi:ribosome biogenesis GTPase
VNLDELTKPLIDIGWNAHRFSTLPALSDGQRIARIVAQHRNTYHACDGQNVFNVHAKANIVRNRSVTPERPGVGDWVVLSSLIEPHIEYVLPRYSALIRAAAGNRYQQQMIAANVDVVFIVCGLDKDFNLRRIERYLVFATTSGAQAVVVLSKADLHEDAEQARQTVIALSGTQIPVLCINAKNPESTQQLAHFLTPGTTAVVVGSSGAGKSTLTNTLLGFEKQTTAQVRTHDHRGRHTTTHRALLTLPSGACLIDTPGMRELKLTGEEKLDETLIASIAELAQQCRFRDCSHQTEPGCKIIASVQSGEMDAEQYKNFCKMRDESAEIRKDRAHRDKAEIKTAQRAYGKRLVDKWGSR